MLFFNPYLLSKCFKVDKVDDIQKDRIASYFVNSTKLVDGEEIKMKNKD